MIGAIGADRIRATGSDRPVVGTPVRDASAGGRPTPIEQVATASQTCDASAPWTPRRASRSRSPSAAQEHSRRCRSTSNALPPPTALTTSRSQPLRVELGAAVVEHVAGSSPVSAAKPTTTWPGRAGPDELGEDVRVPPARSGPARRRSFLILWSARPTGRKSATAAAITTTSAPVAAAVHRRRAARARCRPGTTSTPGRVAQVGGVRGDQRHLGAALRGDPGERVALPAGGAVAEEAHRVERLAGAAGGDDDAAALEVARQRRSPRSSSSRASVDDLGRVGQPARAGVRAGQPARRRAR